MIVLRTAVFCVAVSSVCGLEILVFPPGFKFGVASAAYQVEGAWNVSDKGENIWDRYTHEHPERISDRSSGDVACDSYRLWRTDLDMIKDIGAHFYRFSIAWSRLLPNGFANKISEDGKRYYSELIDGLLERGIEPVATLYHWDLPQSLQDLGGWTNPLISDWFADYARIAFSLYGDRVSTWITINEPLIVCDMPYNTGGLAPGIVDPDVAPYLCSKNAMIAHAKAWRIYDEEFRPKYHGKISITNHMIWFEPEAPEFEELAELTRQNLAGRYCHPIYTQEGGWPPTLEAALAENSLNKGYARPNLPPFTAEEIELVKGTYDFFGVNFYTSRQVRLPHAGETLEPWPMGDAPDLGAKLDAHPDWKATSSFWFYVNPPGLRKQLVWLRQQYGDQQFFITENGFPTTGGLDDMERIQFYRQHLEQVLLAIKDGVDVTAYTAWTLMDNFEWLDGYHSKFGLYEVDFTSANRTRTPRASASYFSNIIRSHSLNTNDIH